MMMFFLLLNFSLIVFVLICRLSSKLEDDDFCAAEIWKNQLA